MSCALSALLVKTPAVTAACACAAAVVASTFERCIAKRRRRELLNFLHSTMSPPYMMSPLEKPMPAGSICWLAFARSARSEEHTSELQSRGHLVCRLLLE